MEQYIDFDPIQFMFYNASLAKPRFGYISSKLKNKEYRHEIRATSLKEDDFLWTVPDKNKNNGTMLCGKITNASYDFQAGSIIVYVDDVEVSDLLEEGDIQVETKKKEEQDGTVSSGRGGNDK